MEELEPWRETPGYTDAPKASPPDPEVGSEIALELLHHVIEKGGELARRGQPGPDSERGGHRALAARAS